MNRKLFALLLAFLILAPIKSRLLSDMEEEEIAVEDSMSETELIDEPEIKQELIIRPQDINVSLLQHAFKDTILHLKAEKDIRIKIKVHNQKFLPFFN